MSSIDTKDEDGTSYIVVHGSFVFDLHKPFRQAYQSLPGGRRVVVDLSRADYIDSAGLGMLLRLREHLGGDSATITLHGANTAIREILDVANFGRLFQLD
ncbi:MAG: STAS domain-containing protein [Gammaproteobacteria bacterium]|nr:STAS domain-containing protein [Gammaproteobacteria bacterium]